MSRLAERLDALTTMKPAALRDEWEKVYGGPAPNLSPDLLRHGVAYRLQERAIGKLPAVVIRRLKAKPTAPQIKLGTQLVRSWQGRTIAVRTVENGFEFEGQTHRSLSAIAKLVTGCARSGPSFFGVRA